MTNQERAKAAVDWLRGSDLDCVGVDLCDEIIELLRPIAAGTHGILPFILLKKYGYAKGNYSSTCLRCNQIKHDMDKRAICCLDCAMIAESQEGEVMAKEFLRRNLIQAGSYGLLAQIDTIEKRASNNKQTPKWLLQAIYELQKRANAIPQELTLWRDSAPDNPYLTKVKP